MAQLSARERKLARTLADPVLWGQAYLRNRDGAGRVYWSYNQKVWKYTEGDPTLPL